MSKKLLIPIISCFTLLSADILKSEATIGYEEWKLPKNEKLGMTHFGLLFNFTPNWYEGIEIYGASRGKRGGFFALGVDSGLKTNFSKYIDLKSGIFIGAGGGGAAPQGGGLMLRPYVEMLLKNKNFSIGIGASRVKFPNGNINSSQIYSSLYIPLYSKSKQSDTSNYDEWNLLLKSGIYKVDSSSKTLSGKSIENMKWIGVELQKIYPNNLFTSISMSAAGGGASAGYMETFAGLGYQLKNKNIPIYLQFQSELGLGGGGKINSGGGALYRFRTGIYTNIYKDLTIGLEASHLSSFNSKFKTDSLGVSIGYDSFYTLNANSSPINLDIRLIEKSHLKAQTKQLKKHRVDMLGIAIDRYLNKYFYLTGQTFWAYKGKAGGYAEGLLGLGAKVSIYNKFNIWTEALIGAGGGGGVKTNGGAILSANIGLSYKINKKLSWKIGTGYTKSLHKGLSTVDTTIQLEYKFNLFEKK